MVIFNTDTFRYGSLRQEGEDNNANTRIYGSCYMVMAPNGKSVFINYFSFYTYTYICVCRIIHSDEGDDDF
jgi:hypothetical protein